MKKSTSDLISTVVVVAVLIFVAISLLINTGKSCDVSIDYNVEIGEEANITQLNEETIKYACLKLCVNELETRPIMMSKCFEECSRI